MKNRTRIPAADLYVMLQREFRRRQVRECDRCYVQLPFLIDRADSDAGNWELIIPQECARGCREILDEIVEEFSRSYDLAPEAR